ncbi:efflux RND transporter periplasmic adaptor subunit [Pseudomonas sp. S1(2024)]|uniref:efflux RND transporter periplasmic adaptor subunit n=1 Tax=Pseudomonas sp. S1(2024) TaxID=3390191 RepID=UPI00397973A2
MRACKAFCALSAAILLAGCGNSGAPSQNHRAPTATPVHTQRVDLQRYTPTLTVLGQAVASAQVDIKAKTTGLLEAKHFADGNAVEQGQVLFTLEQTDLNLALKQADAQLQSARASLDQALREERRQANLLANKAAARQDYDNALSTLQVEQARVNSALAARDIARKGMADSVIKAPFSGKLGIATVSVGDYLSPSNNLVTLTAVSPMWVTFALSQLQYQAMFPAGLDDAKVNVLLEDGSVVGDAKLDYTSPEISSSYGTVTLRASLGNDDDRLKAGQYVRVTVSGASLADVSLIPLKAVQQSEAGPYVYVVKDGKAQRQAVGNNGWNTTEYQVASGLEANAEVVLDNLLKIYPGAPVEVIQDGTANKDAK